MLSAMTELSRLQTWPQCEYLLHHGTSSSPLARRPNSSDGLRPVQLSTHMNSFTNQINSHPQTSIHYNLTSTSDHFTSPSRVHTRERQMPATYYAHELDRDIVQTASRCSGVSISCTDDPITSERCVHNSPDLNAGLQIFTAMFSQSGQNGPEDHTSLEISSETQRAMESCDSSPPSVEKAERSQPLILKDPIRFGEPVDLNTSTVAAVKTMWQNPLFREHPQSTDLSSIKQETTDYENENEQSSEANDQDSQKSSSPHSPTAFTDSEQVMRCQTINQSYSEPHSSGEDDSDEGMSMTRFEQMSNSIQPDQAGLYFCHLCEFTGGSRQEFQDHLHSHYDYKCYKCDYTSRTEGRLRRHMKDFHSEIPPGNFSGKAVKTIRPKLQRCKQCNFMTETKDEFWRHLRVHIKEDKRLECHLCCFVTEYKHHLEYHMRNHMGSKPYKCPKCNYECVNKSMLNSHMKSHSNVYPYRCSNCHYATKYCHSLKMHLAKHGHKPAVVLNADGSLPAYDNTVELMNLRRGPNARHSTVRGRAVVESPCTTSDHASIRSCEPTFAFPGPQVIPFSHSPPVNSLVNCNTGTSPVLKHMPDLSDSLAFGSYATFPFTFPTHVPPFAAVMFPNPLIASPHLFPGANSPSKSGEPVSTRPSQIFNPLPFMDNSFGTPVSQGEQIKKFPYNWSPAGFPVPNASLMAALLTAVQHNTSMYAASDISTSVTSTEWNTCSGTPVAWFPYNRSGKTTSTLSPTFVPSVSCASVDPRGGVQEFRGELSTNSVAPHSGKRVETTMCEAIHGKTISHNQSTNMNLKHFQAECALDLSAKSAMDEWSLLDSRLKLRKSTQNGYCESDLPICKNDGELVVKPNVPDTNGVQKSEFPDESSPFHYECRFCEIRFRQRALYDIHMGFHSHKDPYLCNRCGHQSHDPVEFFIHLGQMAHHL